MPRHKLRDTSIKTLCNAGKPGIFSDGDGLYFRIQPSGSRSWVFIWRRHGARREIGLGAYGSGAGQVSLAAARVKAEEARAIVGSGGDPKALMAERQAAKTKSPTFGQVCGEFIDAMKSKWRSAPRVVSGTKSPSHR